MKTYHIAAYTFRAEEQCPDCIANWAEDSLKNEHNYSDSMISDVLFDNGLQYDPGFAALNSEILLAQLADELQIDISDPYSFDSSDFPKIIFGDQLERDERCALCNERLG